MVLPDQKVAFKISRTVASCEAIKFKSNYQRWKVHNNCAPLQRLELSTEKWRLSVIEYNSPYLVCVASSVSYNSFFLNEGL